MAKVGNQAEIVGDGITFPEGLAWSEDDQTLVVTGVQDGAVFRVWPKQGRVERIADTTGGANNCSLAADGGIVVTQNGGIDAHAALSPLFPDLADWPAISPAKPGIQLVRSDGSVEYILDSGINCPNDVAVADDGALVFTDPGNPFLEVKVEPVVRRLSPDGELSVVADGWQYCNGIAIVDDGAVLVTDHEGIVRVEPDGSRSWVARDVATPSPDGLAVDVDGRLYVAASLEAGVRVFEDGKPVEFLPIPGEGVTTNCCFGGLDRRWLFATDARRGTIVVWEGMPAPGRPANLWRSP